jgi:PPM family protein phosphatase
MSESTAIVLRSGAATSTGLVRASNQDRVLVVDGRLFAVADGMGGHRGGEVAAGIAVDTLAAADARASRGTGDDAALWLRTAVDAANQEVFQRSVADHSLSGMGTTITALMLVEKPDEPMIVIANVGDSRTYRLRAGELEALTEDHNVVAELIRDGTITPEQARTHPRRSVMTRSVGVEPDVQVDMSLVLIAEGDRFLLCSDGLHGFVNDSRIAAALRRLADPEEAARELIDLAMGAGAPDNVSVIVVDVVSDGGVALSASRVVEVVPVEQPMTARSAIDSADDDGERVAFGSVPSAGVDSDRGRQPRLVTSRSVIFIALLGLIGAVIVWAVRVGSSDPTPLPTTAAVTSTIDPFQDAPSTSSGVATTSGIATTRAAVTTIGSTTPS